MQESTDLEFARETAELAVQLAWQNPTWSSSECARAAVAKITTPPVHLYVIDPNVSGYPLHFDTEAACAEYLRRNPMSAPVDAGRIDPAYRRECGEEVAR